MININNYILEKLKINKDTTLYYKYHPKIKQELQELLIKLIEERGLNADLNDIDVSEITDFSFLFKNRLNNIKNIDISNWDMSNAIMTHYMFAECSDFNCDLSGWDVSKVEDMHAMFANCHKFNCDLSDWDVSKVQDMRHMFIYCYSFTGEGLEKWKTSSVISLKETFEECKKFNADLSKWDVTNVISIVNTFKNCRSFKGKGLENWKLPNLKPYHITDTFTGSCVKIFPTWYKKIGGY